MHALETQPVPRTAVVQPPEHGLTQVHPDGLAGTMVRVEDLCRTFAGNIVAVDHVSFDIRQGEFITLLGPSGCGKTTLLRMLAGFEKPTGGRIRLAGEDVTDQPPYLRNVNMVFQDYALFPHLTVEGNVAFGLKRKFPDKTEMSAKVRDALNLVNLGDKAARWPHALSGGQRQRVALARALVRNPRVLLLDEPLSALDAGLREAMQVELKRLNRALGITFIMVTHDQTEALVLSDRVVVMNRGAIAQIGTPAELYQAPNSVYVASFVGTTSFLDAVVEASDGQTVSVTSGNARFRCVSSLRPAPGSRVRLGVRPENLRPADGLDSADAINRLRCTIVDQLYHGNHTRYRCRLETGEELLWDWQSQDHGHRAVEPPRVGQTILLETSPQDPLLFAGEEGR